MQSRLQWQQVLAHQPKQSGISRLETNAYAASAGSNTLQCLYMQQEVPALDCEADLTGSIRPKQFDF